MRWTCAVPLRLRGTILGALNLFRTTDEPFTDVELRIAQAMAQVAAIGLLQQRNISDRQLLSEQLQTALHSRVVIEQAKGVLAEYLNITVDEAFQQLRNHARKTNSKLTDLAHDVATKRIGADAFTAPTPQNRLSPARATYNRLP
jgi:GAF domain-containing protein